MPSINWKWKIIRDPLYGYIGLTERETKLIDTEAMQRLKRIKQLGLIDNVYPSGIHSRFEHSLGALFVADRISQQLQINGQDREIIRVAALLHDVGHGPFSHVFEDILQNANGKEIDHDDITQKIIEISDFATILSDIKSNVLNIFREKQKESIEKDIISSALDADKLDYLRRDSYHTGVVYGVFDIERIIYMLETDDKREHVVVNEKGKEALESFRLARYLMHMNVYQHHVRAIADRMLTRAASLAFVEGGLRKEEFQIENNNFLPSFLYYDDFKLINKIEHSGGEAKKLVERLAKRKLFKRAYEKDVSTIDILKRMKLEKMRKEDFSDMEKRIAEEASLAPHLVIVYPRRIENPVYHDPDRYFRKETPILIKEREGRIMPFEDISPITGAQQKYVEKLFVFCPEEKKEAVNKATEKYLDSL